MSYFRAGFWHFVIAILWAIALGAFTGSGRVPFHFPAFPRDDPFFWLRQPPFLTALIVSSSACFFIPDAWSKKGLMKFLHYPLPDWDVLLLGPAFAPSLAYPFAHFIRRVVAARQPVSSSAPSLATNFAAGSGFVRGHWVALVLGLCGFAPPHYYFCALYLQTARSGFAPLFTGRSGDKLRCGACLCPSSLKGVSSQGSNGASQVLSKDTRNP